MSYFKKNVFAIMLFFIYSLLVGCNFIKESPQERETLSNHVETPDLLLQDNKINHKTAKPNGNKTNRSEKIHDVQEAPDALEITLENKSKAYYSKKPHTEKKVEYSEEPSSNIEKPDALLNQ